MLGGLTLGWWRSLDELAARPKSVQPFEPRISQAERERLRGLWWVAVERARLRPERAT
jgi:glycerol kinase